MALDAKRTAAGRADVLCCLSVKPGRGVATEGAAEPAGAPSAGARIPSAGSSTEGTTEPTGSSESDKTGGGGDDGGGGKFAGLLQRKYLPAMANPKVQAAVLAVKAVMLV